MATDRICMRPFSTTWTGGGRSSTARIGGLLQRRGGGSHVRFSSPFRACQRTVSSVCVVAMPSRIEGRSTVWGGASRQSRAAVHRTRLRGSSTQGRNASEDVDSSQNRASRAAIVMSSGVSPMRRRRRTWAQRGSRSRVRPRAGRTDPFALRAGRSTLRGCLVAAPDEECVDGGSGSSRAASIRRSAMRPTAPSSRAGREVRYARRRRWQTGRGRCPGLPGMPSAAPASACWTPASSSSAAGEGAAGVSGPRSGSIGRFHPAWVRQLRPNQPASRQWRSAARVTPARPSSSPTRKWHSSYQVPAAMAEQTEFAASASPARPRSAAAWTRQVVTSSG